MVSTDTTLAQLQEGEFFYFAYGSNMSSERLRARAPSADFIGAGQLTEHKLHFHKKSIDGSGKCDAFETGDRGDIVMGAVYRILHSDQNALDDAEGFRKGYDRKTVSINLEDSQFVQAIIYFATNIDRSLKPFDWYMYHVLEGAKQSKLPSEYVDLIAKIEAIEDPDQKKRVKELSIYR